MKNTILVASQDATSLINKIKTQDGKETLDLLIKMKKDFELRKKILE